LVAWAEGEEAIGCGGGGGEGGNDAVPLEDELEPEDEMDMFGPSQDEAEEEKEEEEPDPEEEQDQEEEEEEQSGSHVSSTSSSSSSSSSKKSSVNVDVDKDEEEKPDDQPETLTVEDRDPKQKAFPQLHHSWFEDNGKRKENYMRLSQPKGKPWMDIHGRCARHDHQLSRSCRSARPIGEVWAWLTFGMRPECKTKDDHDRFEVYPGPCIRGRKAVLDMLPESKPWFEAEFDSEKGYDKEPGDVAS